MPPVIPWMKDRRVLHPNELRPGKTGLLIATSHGHYVAVSCIQCLRPATRACDFQLSRRSNTLCSRLLCDVHTYPIWGGMDYCAEHNAALDAPEGGQ